MSTPLPVGFPTLDIAILFRQYPKTYTAIDKLPHIGLTDTSLSIIFKMITNEFKNGTPDKTLASMIAKEAARQYAGVMHALADFEFRTALEISHLEMSNNIPNKKR